MLNLTLHVASAAISSDLQLTPELFDAVVRQLDGHELDIRLRVGEFFPSWLAMCGEQQAGGSGCGVGVAEAMGSLASGLESNTFLGRWIRVSAMLRTAQLGRMEGEIIALEITLQRLHHEDPGVHL